MAYLNRNTVYKLAYTPAKPVFIVYDADAIDILDTKLFRHLEPTLDGYANPHRVTLNQAAVQTTVDVVLPNGINIFEYGGTPETKLITQAVATTLQTNIEAEASARAAADIILQNNITAEASARATADAQLNTKIEQETSRATGAEAALGGALAAEISRAQGIEAQLDTKISQEASRANTAEARIALDLANEISRSTGKDSAHDAEDVRLAGLIATEKSRAETAEAGITTALNTHKNDKANPHETTLQQAANQTTGATVNIGTNHFFEQPYGAVVPMNKLITMQEALDQFGQPMHYMGQLKFGAMTVADMNSIPTAATTPGKPWAVSGDLCGVQATQLTYMYNGVTWVAQPQGTDTTGDMYDMLFWYGVWEDGKTYTGEVSAQIKCRDGATHAFDLSVHSDLLLPDEVKTVNIEDAAVTDAKIGPRTINYTPDVYPTYGTETKTLSQWIETLRNNIGWIFGALDGRFVDTYTNARPNTVADMGLPGNFVLQAYDWIAVKYTTGANTGMTEFLAVSAIAPGTNVVSWAVIAQIPDFSLVTGRFRGLTTALNPSITVPRINDWMLYTVPADYNTLLVYNGTTWVQSGNLVKLAGLSGRYRGQGLVGSTDPSNPEPYDWRLMTSTDGTSAYIRRYDGATATWVNETTTIPTISAIFGRFRGAFGAPPTLTNPVDHDTYYNTTDSKLYQYDSSVPEWTEVFQLPSPVSGKGMFPNNECYQIGSTVTGNNKATITVPESGFVFFEANVNTTYPGIYVQMWLNGGWFTLWDGYNSDYGQSRPNYAGPFPARAGAQFQWWGFGGEVGSPNTTISADKKAWMLPIT